MKYTLSALTLAALASAAVPAMAQSARQDGAGKGARASDLPGCSVFPAPASIGTKIGLSYFGPPASESNPSFVGPHQELRSGKIDDLRGRVTLPLYKGYMTGTNTPVWYILTDVSDQAQAQALGLNFSAKLQFAAIGARTGHFGAGNALFFDTGAVDFSPQRVVRPGKGPNAFPPSASAPGSVGDEGYSPYVKVGSMIYNAPVIAYGSQASEINFPNGKVDYSKVHDEVLSIDTVNGTVTLLLVNGFSFGRPVWYLVMDSSDRGVAGVEGVTYAPLLGQIPVGGDDSFSSAVERIFVNTNAALPCEDPRRQGLGSALTDGFRANNTLGGIPSLGLDYSPAWDVNFWEFTPDAINKNYRQQLREEFQILTYVQDGLVTGPSGAAFGSSGVINNCPIVLRLN